MLLSSKLLVLVSIVWRIGAWVFLRILPGRQAPWAVPILYFSYLLLWTRIPYGQSLPPTNGHSNGNGNGHITEKQSANGSSEIQQKEPTSSSTLPPPTALRVLFSVPTSSRRANLIALAINTLLFLFSLDLLYTPMLFFGSEDLAFSRLGAISPTSAKILVRIPPSFPSKPILNAAPTSPLDNLAASGLGPENPQPLDQPEVTGSPPSSSTRIMYRAARPVGTWQAGPELNPLEERDWVQTVVIDGLEPGRKYEYILPATAATPEPRPRTFQTAPDPLLSRQTGSHFTFLATSCIKPNYPYSANPLHHRLRIPGVQLLADWLAKPPRLSPHHRAPSYSSKRQGPSFALFLGDWIYADTPLGGSGADGDSVGWFGWAGKLVGRGGDGKGWFRRLYRQVYARPETQQVLEKLPMLHILDDHEIINNFAGEGHPEDQSPYPKATSAYEIYQGDANPDPSSGGAWWYDFDHGDTSFFVMDTRAERSNEQLADGPDKTMLGLEQKEALFEWLGRVNETATFKFLVSSVPFNSLWGKPDGHKDTWAGYRHERNEIMDVLEYVPNVVVLSGDRHEHLAVELRETVVEFSTSPLSQFYVPFIPTVRQDLSRYYVPARMRGNTTREDGSVASAQTVGRDGLGAVGTGVPGQPIRGKPGDEKGILEEKILKYIPHGNVKWSSLEVDTRDRDHPRVNYELWVDGELAWHYDIVGKPVRPHTQSLGLPTVGGLKDILASYGLLPKRWF